LAEVRFVQRRGEPKLHAEVAQRLFEDGTNKRRWALREREVRRLRRSS
jgi:hypothetical protein